MAKTYRSGLFCSVLLIGLPTNLLIGLAIVSPQSNWWFLLWLLIPVSWLGYRRVGVVVDDDGIELRGLFASEHFKVSEGLVVYVPGQLNLISNLLKIRRGGERFRPHLWFSGIFSRKSRVDAFIADIEARHPEIGISRKPPLLIE